MNTQKYNFKIIKVKFDNFSNKNKIKMVIYIYENCSQMSFINYGYIFA